MKPVDLMIFDLDGTLAATGEDLAVSVNYALEKLGLTILPQERIIGYVGDGIRNLMQRAVGPGNESRTEEAIALFSSYYGGHIMDHTVLYDGVRNCLDYFDSKKKIVMSNKGENFAEIILEKLGISRYFVRIIGGDTYDYMKPDARLVHRLWEAYGTDPGRTLIVGDGRNDILLAKNAGILSCAFLGGLTKRDLLLSLNPDFTCESLAELPALFV